VTAARKTLIALLALIGAGALALSASSTLQLATQAGVQHVQVAAIAVLELSSIVGTVMWLRTTTTRGRVEAAALVVGASLVAAVGGLGAYGLFGLVGPAFLVWSVHVASGEWRAAPRDNQDDQDNLTAGQSEPAPVQDEPQWSGPDTVELPRLPDTRPVDLVQPGPRLQAVQTGGTWSVEDIVADLREHGIDAPSGQYIRKNYRTGPGKASKVLAALQPQETAS